MAKNETKFKKGDTVKCAWYGIGYVISHKSGIKNFPIEVEFQSDNSTVFYTKDGSSIAEGKTITLKHHKHNFRGCGLIFR